MAEFKESMTHQGLPGASPLREEAIPMHKNIERKRIEETRRQSRVRLSPLLKAATPSHAQIPIIRIQIRIEPFSAFWTRAAFQLFINRPNPENQEKEVENSKILAQLFHKNPLAEKSASGT